MIMNQLNHNWRTTLLHQIVGERLAIAGLNVAYGMAEYPQFGPFLNGIYHVEDLGDSVAIGIFYGPNLKYNPVDNSGFYYCAVDYQTCDDIENGWSLVSHHSIAGEIKNLSNPAARWRHLYYPRLGPPFSANTRVKFEIVTDVTPSSDNLVQFWPRLIFVVV